MIDFELKIFISKGKFKSIFIIHNIAINFNKVGLVFLNYVKNDGFYTQFCFLSNIWNFQPVLDFRFLMVVAYFWIKISTVTYFWLVYLVENNQQFLFFQQITRQFLNSSKNITCLKNDSYKAELSVSKCEQVNLMVHQFFNR